MSNFTEPLLVEELPSGDWITRRELVYFVGEEDSDDKIIVPNEFITDFFSVPWPANMLIAKSQKGNAAAVLHDFLYNIIGEIKLPYNKIKRSRAQCDRILKESMKVLMMNWFIRGTIFNAVRVGGWFAWDRQTKQLKNNVV